MKKIKELKLKCKEKANNIKELKKTIKEKMQDYKYAGNEQYELILIKKDYRHHHIAYCLLRGTLMPDIERPKPGNEPCMKIVNEIFDAYKEEMIHA